MKKKYSKPLITYEDFCLSENIAGNCEVKTWTPAQYQCPYLTRDGHQVFVTPILGCTTKEADGEYNGVCYHVPVANHTLFNS